MIEQTLFCRNCHKEFTATRSDATYCSNSCRTQAYYGRKKLKDRYTTFSLRVTKDEYQLIRSNLASVYKIDRTGLEIYIMALLKDFPQIIQGRIEEYKQLMKQVDAIVNKKYGLIK